MSFDFPASSPIRLTSPSATATSDYCSAMIRRHWPRSRAATTPRLRDAAANYAVAHGTLEQASAALRAYPKTRRHRRRLVGTRTLALVSLYLSPPKSSIPPPALAAFTCVLRQEASIAERLANPFQPASTVSGDLWFATASRFGIARLAIAPEAAEDQLPAPARAISHVARALRGPGPHLWRSRQPARRVRRIPPRPRACALAAARPRRDGRSAIARGKTPQPRSPSGAPHLRSCAIRSTATAYSESFYTAFVQVLGHLGQRHLTADAAAGHRSSSPPGACQNGNYRSNELLEAVYEASASPQAGDHCYPFAFRVRRRPGAQVLDDLTLTNSPWLDPAAREVILARSLQLALAAGGSDSQLSSVRHRLLTADLATKKRQCGASLCYSTPFQRRSSIPRLRRLASSSPRTGRPSHRTACRLSRFPGCRPVTRCSDERRQHPGQSGEGR